MTPVWQRMRAVVALELRVQRREPLTVLYMLVFALLAMAFTAAGPVELVRGRGAVPRDAAWSVMLASTAITAFGQVITTMVAATVVLRDRADRVADLLRATRLTDTEYRVAKLVAALLMLAVIYAAIPFGLVTGAVLGGGSAVQALRGSLPPFVVVVLPTMVAIGALQFAAGVLSGRLWVIVGQGLVLIWLWTWSIDAATDGSDAWRALIDPFGSAPLLVATREWSDAERMTRAMPVTAVLVASRALWLVLGAAAATLAVMFRPAGRVSRERTVATPVAVMDRHAAGSVVARAGAPRWWAGAWATAQYVARWMLRDAGWRVLALLGALNVGVHAARDLGPGADAIELLAVLQEHARLFLILLATIYAGELVWREREERSAALFDALPVSRSAAITGRLLGVITAQAVLVLLLGVAALLGSLLATGEAPVEALLLLPGRVGLPFVGWLLISLAVHVVVQQKVVAHLMCIAGWAVASVVFGASTAAADARIPPGNWAVVCLLAVCFVFVLWQRDGEGRRWHRRPHVARAVV